MENFQESRFRHNVDEAMKSARLVLSQEKTPQFLADTAHSYDDKFTAAEQLTCAAFYSVMCTLDLAFGLTPDEVSRVFRKTWKKDRRALTLRFKAREGCRFVESFTHQAHEHEGLVGAVRRLVVRSPRRLTYYVYEVTSSVELCLFPGSTEKGKRVLWSRASATRLVTTSEQLPLPEATVRDPVDVNLTDFFAWVHDLPFVHAEVEVEAETEAEASSAPRRAWIDRSLPTTRTPRRNAFIEHVLSIFGELFALADHIERHFFGFLLPLERRHADPRAPPGRDDAAARLREAVTAHTARVPLLPAVVEAAELDLLLAEQERELREKLTLLGGLFPDPPRGPGVGVNGDAALGAGDDEERVNVKNGGNTSALREDDDAENGSSWVSGREARLLGGCRHLRAVLQGYSDAIGHLEVLLRRQLRAALGRHVGAGDFAHYMRFHRRRVFAPHFAPQPMIFAVRRAPDADPVASVEIAGMQSFCRSWTPKRGLRVALPGAGVAELRGRRHLHGVVRQDFARGGEEHEEHEKEKEKEKEGEDFAAKEEPCELRLTARPFGAFAVLIGRMEGPDDFRATHAFVLRNRDALRVPLLLEQIPTAKEFKEAVVSLSPVMQRFASMFRAMQLESTLFAVAVVEIKPSLERVLRLAPEALTKEIRLTEDVLDLFLRYQIPSDLLSYDEARDAEGLGDVASVARNVRQMMEMIEGKKRDELVDQKMVAQYDGFDSSSDYSEEEEEEEVDEEVEKEYECDGDGDDFDTHALEDMLEDLCVAGESMAGNEDMPVMSAGKNRTRRRTKEITKKGSKESMDRKKPERKIGKEKEVDKEPEPEPTKDEAGEEEPEKPEEPEEKEKEDEKEYKMEEAEDEEDVSGIPKKLESNAEFVDAALRPTIVHVGPTLQKKSFPTLVGGAVERELDGDAQREEKNRCMDLLDALTRSGSLAIEEASLHVIVVSTHCFDRTLEDTVIMDNVNPIEKVECSDLIVAGTVHGRPPLSLLKSPADAAALQGRLGPLFEQMKF